MGMIAKLKCDMWSGYNEYNGSIMTTCHLRARCDKYMCTCVSESVNIIDCNMIHFILPSFWRL